jgi:hypothetical protein
MLSTKKGFYAFESALHVFPSYSHGAHMSLQRWNAAGTWKSEFGDFLDPLTCFAEDIFGNQFGILDEVVVVLNAESGEIRTLTRSLEERACQLLADYQLPTGFPFAHEWQALFGPLKQDQRLVPKRAFIFGGEYAVDNLYSTESAGGMRVRGHIYQQIRDLPDGSKVRLSIKR